MKTILLLLLFILPVSAQDSLMAEKSHHIYNGFRNPFAGFDEKGFKDLMKWMLWDRLINNSRSEDADTVVFDMAQSQTDWLKRNASDFSIT